MNNKFKKRIYSLCAAVGFLSAALMPYPYSTALAESQPISAYELWLSGGNAHDKEHSTAAKFTDVSSDAWYYRFVDALVRRGVINGVSETEYSPTGTFTLAEGSAVITRYLGLEEYSSKRQREMQAYGIAGSELWYAGYIQTLFDTGILLAGEAGIPADADELVSIDVQSCSMPLERYFFASLVTRSFDIKTDKTLARSIPSEICANGNSFITGGSYDDTVTRYAEEITDYWAIPESFRMDVLKAYYNGIFNGDEAGNFNPFALLTRAEMSKVVAVVTDTELRERTEYRNVDEICRLTEDKFIKDGWNEKTLDRVFGATVLEKASGMLSVGAVGGNISASYTPFKAPEGYMIDVRFYKKDGNTYDELYRVEISETEKQETVSNAPMRVIFTLRNSDDAKVEGVLRVDVSTDGTVEQDNLFKSVY